MSKESNFLSSFPEEFATTTESDFKGTNSGYVIGQKLLLGQCKDLQARENQLREEIREKDATINSLKISNGLYASSSQMNIVGIILTFLGSSGVGLAFSAPISLGWRWGLAVFSLIISLTGTLLPSLIRKIAHRASSINDY